jgi:hypothetical protein
MNNRCWLAHSECVAVRQPAAAQNLTGFGTNRRPLIAATEAPPHAHLDKLNDVALSAGGSHPPPVHRVGPRVPRHTAHQMDLRA